MGDHRTYAMQTVKRMYVGPMGVRYFFEYPLDNTWTYETPSGPMYKEYRTYDKCCQVLIHTPYLCLLDL
jgi:hypothetical protein